MDKVKKRFHVTSQLLSEKVGGNTGTELGDDIHEMWRQTEVIDNSVEKVIEKTWAFLRPNPTERTKHSIQASFQKARGEVDKHKYRQPEYKLGEVLKKYGEDLKTSSYTSSLSELGDTYGTSLTELGEALQQVAEAKDSLDASVKHNFLLPLNEMKQNEIKEIGQHKKKVEGRRLDYDYKEAKGDKKMSADELQEAQNKYNESKQLYYEGLMDFVENDAGHIKQLHVFAEAMRDYHKQSGDIMDQVAEALDKIIVEVGSRSQIERKKFSRISDSRSPRLSRSSRSSNEGEDNYSQQTVDNNVFLASNESRPPPFHPSAVPPPLPSRGAVPCCRALYDFEAEAEGDLTFNEGDIIQLLSRVDENWLEGTINGRHGYFPESYVEIMVPI